MGLHTKIEYCDSTINPVVGCSGCELYHPELGRNHCYAARLTRRYEGRPGWPARFTEPKFFPGSIEQALAWPDLTGTERPDKPWLAGYPRIVFINDLGDGFCPAAPPPEVWLYPRLQEMADSPHVWLFLSKWPEPMYEAFRGKHEWRGAPNFWFGTSYTGLTSDTRLVDLAQFAREGCTTWLSLEPLLAPVKLVAPRDVIAGLPPYPIESVDWIVAGGETGHNARQPDIEWFREIRDVCEVARVPFFFKHWGGAERQGWVDEETHTLRRGRKLDGREWNQMPPL